MIAGTDIEVKEEFKKLRTPGNDPTVELWAIDEVIFNRHGSTCRMWIAPEDKDPRIYLAPTSESVGYFGAVIIRVGKFVYMREADTFNGETFFRFLKHLRRITAPTKKKIVLIIDNARYRHANLHKEWKMDYKDRFCLEFLPPYSSELNVIERVWKLTRKLCTHNRYFPDLEAIIVSVEKQFNDWRESNDVLRRLCAIN